MVSFVDLPLRVFSHELDDFWDLALVDQHHTASGSNAIILKGVFGLCDCRGCRQLKVLGKLCVLLEHLFLGVEKECNRLGLE